MNNNVAESTIQLLDASELDNVDQVKDLLAQGADPNAQDEFGWTALMVAAAHGGEKVAEHLLSLPTIDTEVRDEKGLTALLWAAGHGHLRLVKIVAALPRRDGEAGVGNKRESASLFRERHSTAVLLQSLRRCPDARPEPPPRPHRQGHRQARPRRPSARDAVRRDADRAAPAEPRRLRDARRPSGVV